MPYGSPRTLHVMGDRKDFRAKSADGQFESRLMQSCMLECEIQTAYAQSGNTLGWRFLYSPASTLNGTDVAFIGLNPGGKIKNPKHYGFATPEGQSAYINESWAGNAPGDSPLQLQVRALFERLDVAPHKVLAGNIVPFRSQSLATLVNKDWSLEFGCNLWRKVLKQAKPRLVVCMGNDAERQLVKVLNAKYPKSELLGWGAQVGRLYEYEGGCFVRLPHLSRFALMKRAASQTGLDRLFKSFGSM